MVRVRVCGTVDSAVAYEVTQEIKQRQKEAVANKAPIPTKSDVLQDLLVKGLAQRLKR